MNVRMSQNNDQLKIRKLWEEVFPEDSKEYLDFYFDIVMQENSVIVVESELTDATEVVAMLHLNPYTVLHGTQQVKIYYVVAVATKKAYRRQGLMRKMLEYAQELSKKDNIDFLILLPEDERYYRPFEYEFVSKQYNTTIQSSKYVYAQIETLESKKNLSPLTFHEFMEKFTTQSYENENNFVPLRTSKTAYRIYQEISSENGQIFSVDGNLIFVYQYEESGIAKIEVRKVYYKKVETQKEAFDNYDVVKNFLVMLAKGRLLIVHEVQERKVSKCFSYNRQNIYDCRPYMMIKKISQTKVVLENIYFDETV